MKNKENIAEDPSKISTYLKHEKKDLAIITATGLVYNIGMTAGPWFEGQLAQCLADILGGSRTAQDMAHLALSYVIVILIVQGARFLKRLYVRYFANHINRRMKLNLYQTMVNETYPQLQKENSGELLTKAISDVDACAEGIRKFTTEIFDTGVVMIAYMVMLVVYDWRLALISMIFPPVSYLIAEHMKKAVTTAAKEAKESAGRLSSATLDRAENAVTYRIYGEEKVQEGIYESDLSDYEKKNARSDILDNAMQPLYRAVSILSVFFILWLGGRNVMGNGWTVWNIAQFSAFLSCFLKLSTKTSHAAKLFNAVQKAKVSWARIQPYMKNHEEHERPIAESGELSVRNLSFAYPSSQTLLKNISFDAEPGEMIGITGAVASGKSTLGKVFLCEYPYGGSITLNGKELCDISENAVGWMGHQPELFNDTIAHNITMEKDGDVMDVLKDVSFTEDLKSMPDGVNTIVGSQGTGLSGGQQARIALARVLYHKQPVLILDDPFASVDQKTEKEIFYNLRMHYKDRIILLISHRLTSFPKMDHVLFLKDGTGVFASHEELMQKEAEYRNLFEMQQKGSDLDEEISSH